MNLHAIARSSTSSVAKERCFTLFRSNGFVYNIEAEQRVPQFADPVIVYGQMQTLNPMQIMPSDKVSLTSVVRKVYLFSRDQPETLNRTLAKTGDYLKLGAQWWYITGVLEDFSHEGWLCVQVVLQQGGDIPIKEEVDDDAP